MKLEITKACAESLRAFTQNNYGIQLKSSHAHELVAAYFGYASRAALIADKQYSIDNLADAEIIILNLSAPLVDQRLKSLENLPLELPPSNILAEGITHPLSPMNNFPEKYGQVFMTWLWRWSRNVQRNSECLEITLEKWTGFLMLI